MDEQPAWIIARLPTLADAFDEAKATAQEQAAARAKAAQQSGG